MEIDFKFGKLIVDPDIYYRIVRDKNLVPRPYHKYKSLKGLAFLYRLLSCRIGNDSKYTFARMLMRPERNEVVDHINRNPLDNRRSNLRIVSPRQNSLNRMPNSSTGFIGVSTLMMRGKKRVCATFQTISKRMKFSIYDSPDGRIICAIVHDKYVIDAGDDEFAPLNFPILRNEPQRTKLMQMNVSEFRQNTLENLAEKLCIVSFVG